MGICRCEGTGHRAQGTGQKAEGEGMDYKKGVKTGLRPVSTNII